MSHPTEDAISSQFSACPLARRDPEVFETFVAAYADIVLLAVEEATSGAGQPVFGKVRSLAVRAGEIDAEAQDLIAVHLTALARIVANKPEARVRAASIKQSRLLLVKMVGEMAMYYRELAKPQRTLAI